jgi:hypothetical protein
LHARTRGGCDAGAPWTGSSISEWDLSHNSAIEDVAALDALLADVGRAHGIKVRSCPEPSGHG